jgi:hypothetical protein
MKEIRLNGVIMLENTLKIIIRMEETPKINIWYQHYDVDTQKINILWRKNLWNWTVRWKTEIMNTYIMMESVVDLCCNEDDPEN